MRMKLFFISLLLGLSIFTQNHLFAGENLCQGDGNGVSKSNQNKIFPCTSKPGSAYGEVNYKFCANQDGLTNRIIIYEYFYDADCPCNNLLNEKLVNGVLGNLEVQEVFNIKSGGEYSNYEIWVPKKENIVEATPPKVMDCKKCIKVVGTDKSSFDIIKFTVVLDESCDPETKTFKVIKVKFPIEEKPKKVKTKKK
jgi:hypothetical protein